MHEVLLAAGDSDTGNPVGGFLILIMGGLFYFLPLIVAGARKVRNLGSVAVVNVFLGWSCIGWIVALAMALRTVDNTPQGFAQYPYAPQGYPPAPQDYPPNYPPNA